MLLDERTLLDEHKMIQHFLKTRPSQHIGPMMNKEMLVLSQNIFSLHHKVIDI